MFLLFLLWILIALRIESELDWFRKKSRYLNKSKALLICILLTSQATSLFVKVQSLVPELLSCQVAGTALLQHV